MVRQLLVLISGLWTAGSLCSADWVRLADGDIVALLKRQGDQISIKRPDGTQATLPWKDVDGVLKDRDAKREVDQALHRMRTEPKAHAKTGARLAKIGAAAIPTLSDAWKKAASGYDRSLVMACLQYAWSTDAMDMLMAGLEDEDAQVRRLSKIVLGLKVPTKERAEVFGLLRHHSDPALAGPSLQQRLLLEPDRDALLEAINGVTLRSYVHTVVPRHHDLSYQEAALRLLRVGTEMEQASGLLGLIVQLNDHSKVRDLVATRLDDESALLRDLAAEYYRRSGHANDIGSLQARLAVEPDLHTKASVAAAIGAIRHRADHFPPKPEREAEFAIDTPNVLDEARGWFVRFPSSQGRQQLTQLIRQVVPMAPYFTMMTDQDLTTVLDATPPTFTWNVRTAGVYGQLLASIIGLPPGELAHGVPTAEKLVPPVRDYFDAKRNSFGTWIDPDEFPGNPFANSVHVGDDVAWRQQGATVVAIGDGVVRIASSASGGSWGGLVAIEHRTPAGQPFCSVYGHLGLAMNVRSDQIVRAGQKLGTVGRDWTRDNGGFVSHVHFGIYDGPYSRRATSGYLSRPRFDDEENRGWADPQAFIRSYQSLE